MKSPARGLKQSIAVLTLGCAIAAGVPATEPARPVPPQSSEARQELAALDEKWTVAEEKHDLATLRRILDDRFVATFGAARTYDKQAFVALFAGDEVDASASHTVSYDAVIIDGDTAVEVGTYTARGTSDGAAYTAVYRYTTTYIRRRAQWVPLAEHIVKAPQPK